MKVEELSEDLVVLEVEAEAALIIFQEDQEGLGLEMGEMPSMLQLAEMGAQVLEGRFLSEAAAA